MIEPRRPSQDTEWGLWANQMMDWVKSMMVVSNSSVAAQRTSGGTHLSVPPPQPAGAAGVFNHKGQWNEDDEYEQGDIVFGLNDTGNPEIDRHNGMFRARTHVPAGNRPNVGTSIWSESGSDATDPYWELLCPVSWNRFVQMFEFSGGYTGWIELTCGDLPDEPGPYLRIHTADITTGAHHRMVEINLLDVSSVLDDTFWKVSLQGISLIEGPPSAPTLTTRVYLCSGPISSTTLDPYPGS